MPNLIDSFQEKAAPYLRMLRLKHQTIGVIVYVLGLLDANFFRSPTIFHVFAGLILISMAGYLINDYFDSKDTDQFSYRLRSTAQKPVSGTVVLILWLILNLFGIYFLVANNLSFHALILLIVTSLYSAPPFRFKARFMLDFLANFLQGAAIYTVGAALAGQNSLTAMLQIPFITLTVFMGAGEFILLTMDYEADKKGGLRNTGVVLGYKWLIRISKTLLIFSAFAFAALFYTRSNWWYFPMIATLPYFGYAVGRLREASQVRKDLNPLLNISYTRAMTAMSLITFYLIFVFVYGFFNFNHLIPWPLIYSFLR